ncbi:hypothetical protein E4U54_008395 [Claviceps lovelessii]|nr:hypothetical protein E4U54_008395 [Claviceps lovelessii]
MPMNKIDHGQLNPKGSNPEGLEQDGQGPAPMIVLTQDPPCLIGNRDNRRRDS